MANHKPLTEFLIAEGVLEDKTLIKAFDVVDRRDFLPASMRELYLENRPIPIGHMQTNSQPFTVAFMLELLLPQKDEKILDVGSGSGWTAGLIGSTRAKVTGTERIKELVDLANSNLAGYKFKNVEIKHTPKGVGWPKSAPYDKIIVSAGANELPQTLLDQLKDGGRMIIPIKSGIQVIEKTENGVKATNFEGFQFVPLITD